MQQHNIIPDDFNKNGVDKDTNLDGITPSFEFNRYQIGVVDINSEVEHLLKKPNDERQAIGLFTLKTANRWLDEAKLKPIPKMLFSELWFEGELCILFADTNLGKSILAVQIANSISKGVCINGFTLETEKQMVLYFDFELSDKQFEKRYSNNFEEHYDFDNNFIRVEIDPEALLSPDIDFELYLKESLEKTILETNAKVLFVDNITFLKDETEQSKYAKSLMQHLNSLKKQYGLSILVLAHTPKRDQTKPISNNDVQGSKMIMNFCDSSFAIGASQNDKNLRYLKQIKERSSGPIYHSDNVCVCQIGKPHNFLMFEFINYGNESDFLKQKSETNDSQLEERVIALNMQGKSLREIGKELQVSHMTVKRLLS